MYSEGSDGTEGSGKGLLNKTALKALRKLEGPAFNGSLRQAFNEQAGGQGRAEGALSRSHLKMCFLRPRKGHIDTILIVYSIFIRTVCCRLKRGEI